MPAFFARGTEGFGLCDSYVSLSVAVEDPGTLLLLAAARDRSWSGCFSDGGPASHEFAKLLPHLSAVLPCSLEEQMSERFLVKDQYIFLFSIK